MLRLSLISCLLLLSSCGMYSPRGPSLVSEAPTLTEASRLRQSHAGGITDQTPRMRGARVRRLYSQGLKKGDAHSWSSHKHPYYRFPPNYDYWQSASPKKVEAWLHLDASISENNPIYQQEPSSKRQVGLEGDVVHINRDVLVSTERYAQEARELAWSTPRLDANTVEWLSLGVFALTPDSDLITTPQIFLQLNLSREGVISGHYENTQSGQKQFLEGQVDLSRERAAWTFSGLKGPVFDASLSDLSEEVSIILLHFDTKRTQEWMLVRLEPAIAP